VVGAQQHRNECRLPVVAMENVRDAELLGSFEHRTRVHGEAFGVVAIVAGWRLVEALAIIEIRVLYKVKLHPIFGPAVEHRAEAVLVVVWDTQAADQSPRVGELGLSIARQKDVDFVSESRERTRQCADDIGQSASLGERNALRCREGDAHYRSPIETNESSSLPL